MSNSNVPDSDAFFVAREHKDSSTPPVITTVIEVSDGIWTKVLAADHLQPLSVTELQSPTQDQNDENFRFNWSPCNSQGTPLANYEFSSERNSSFFLSNSASTDSFQTTAKIDDNGDGMSTEQLYCNLHP